MNIITIIINVFIHRDNSIWLMGAWYGKRFGGNSRFLFQYLSENKEKYGLSKVIWVTRNKEIVQELKNMGYEVFLMNSIKSLYYHLKSGVHVISVNTTTSFATKEKRQGDILGEFSFGAKHIHINHGIKPFKQNKIMRQNELKGFIKFITKTYCFLYNVYFLRHFILSPGGWNEFVLLLSNHQQYKIQKYREINIEEKKFCVSGFPELCIPLKYTKNEKSILDYIKQKEKIILYIPTYRTDNRCNFEHPLNNKQFQNFLRINGYYWIDKHHPGAGKDMLANDYPSDISLCLYSSIDLNIIAPYANILISDYSSAIVRGIYYQIPIIYYWPDLENYIHYSNGVSTDFVDSIIGEKTKTIDELMESIKFAFSNNYFIKYDSDYKKSFSEIFEEKSDYDKTMKVLLKALN